MVFLICIVIYAIACCIESGEKNQRQSEYQNERRHRELMKSVQEHKHEPRKEKRTWRRIAKNADGVTLAEERIEEIEQ